MSEDKTEEIAEDVKSDNLTETDEPEVNNHPSIKLSGLMGTKLGMTHSLMDDGRVVPTTLVQLGPCYALEKSLKTKKTSLKIGFQNVKPTSLNKPKLLYFSKFILFSSIVRFSK